MSDGRLLTHDWFPRPLPHNVRIGERSWLYSAFAFLHYRSRQPWGVTVGHDSGLYNGTFFDLGPDAEVVIGNYCAVVGGIFCTNGRIEIGDYCFIAHEVLIADDDAAMPPESRGVSAYSRSHNRIVIGPNVWIGARAIVIGRLEIGEGAVVGAASVVRDDVPPFTIVAGNPARVVGYSGPHPTEKRE